MAYCAITDVELINALRGAYSATTKPTATQVGTMIDMIYAEINAVLSSVGLTVPVTANDFLRLTNALGAAAMAEAAGGMPGKTENKDPRDWRWQKYERNIEMLKADPALSGGTAVSSGQYAVNDFTTGYTNSRTDFTRDGDDW